MSTLMRICIPSRGRAAEFARNTAVTIPETWRSRAHVLVPQGEEKAYRKENPEYDIVSVPKQFSGIGRTRQYALDNLEAKYIMMIDDDVKLLKRKSIGLNRARTTPATEEDVDACFKQLLGWLRRSNVAQVGVGASWMCHTKPRMIRNKMCGILNVLDTEIVKDLGIRYDELELGEDSYMTLSLILSGYEVRVTYDYVINQQPTNAPGGCSGYRTMKRQLDACRKFVRLYPEYVKLYYRSRNYNGLGVGVPNVRVAWSKASKSGEGLAKAN